MWRVDGRLVLDVLLPTYPPGVPAFDPLPTPRLLLCPLPASPTCPPRPSDFSNVRSPVQGPLIASRISPPAYRPPPGRPTPSPPPTPAPPSASARRRLEAAAPGTFGAPATPSPPRHPGPPGARARLGAWSVALPPSRQRLSDRRTVGTGRCIPVTFLYSAAGIIRGFTIGRRRRIYPAAGPEEPLVRPMARPGRDLAESFRPAQITGRGRAASERRYRAAG
jgi:hypothetical protein